MSTKDNYGSEDGLSHGADQNKKAEALRCDRSESLVFVCLPPLPLLTTQFGGKEGCIQI